jgi:DNA polymerase alpha subunit B
MSSFRTRLITCTQIGPFVDAANSRIKDGDVDETPQQLFERQFTQRLQGFLEQSPDSLVLLVPSINDMISEYAVFPQCELNNKVLSKDSVSLVFMARNNIFSWLLQHIRLLPNPCRFSVNGISFAVTSVDTLFHLRKEEYFRRTPLAEVDPLTPASEPATDNMSNVARNLLQQRR